MDVNDLGAVVGYERRDGSMAMAAFTGEIANCYANFDCDPCTLPLSEMRNHITSVQPLERDRPEGAIKVICFVKTND